MASKPNNYKLLPMLALGKLQSDDGGADERQLRAVNCRSLQRKPLYKHLDVHALNLRKLYNTKHWRVEMRPEILERDMWLCRRCKFPHQLTEKNNQPDSAIVDYIKTRGKLGLVLGLGKLAVGVQCLPRQRKTKVRSRSLAPTPGRGGLDR